MVRYYLNVKSTIRNLYVVRENETYRVQEHLQVNSDDCTISCNTTNVLEALRIILLSLCQNQNSKVEYVITSHDRGTRLRQSPRKANSLTLFYGGVRIKRTMLTILIIIFSRSGHGNNEQY